MAGWMHQTGQDWTERVAEWAAGTGMDVWIVEFECHDPATYVRMWSADVGGEPDTAARKKWLEWLRHQNVEAVGWGLVTLRNSGRTDPAVRVDSLPNREILGGHVLDWFARQDWLHQHDLLDARYRAVDGLELATGAHLDGNGHWQADRHLITTPLGPPRTDEVTELITAVVAGCDGHIPMRDQLTKLAVARDLDPRRTPRSRHACRHPARRTRHDHTSPRPLNSGLLRNP